EPLARLVVAAEEPGHGHEERSLADERVGEVGRELERAVDLAPDRTQAEEVHGVRSRPPGLLAERAEAREVRERVGIVRLRRLLGALERLREERVAFARAGVLRAVAERERVPRSGRPRRVGGLRRA